MDLPTFKDGKTVLILIWGCDQSIAHTKMGQLGWCEQLVRNVCGAIGMTPITHVSSSFGPPIGPENSGASVVLLIAESHIAVHTWPEDSALRIVIDSCKQFDELSALQAIRAMAGFTDYVVRTIEGPEWVLPYRSKA